MVPSGCSAEYVNVSQDVDAGDRRHDPIGRGSAITTPGRSRSSYVLTGEESTYKGVKPMRPFSIPEAAPWGAFEIKARYSELSLDEDSFAGGDDSFADPTRAARQARPWPSGFNWYLNQNVKLVLNYEQTIFDGGGGGTRELPRTARTKKWS